MGYINQNDKVKLYSPPTKLWGLYWFQHGCLSEKVVSADLVFELFTVFAPLLFSVWPTVMILHRCVSYRTSMYYHKYNWNIVKNDIRLWIQLNNSYHPRRTPIEFRVKKTKVKANLGQFKFVAARGICPFRTGLVNIFFRSYYRYLKY